MKYQYRADLGVCVCVFLRWSWWTAIVLVRGPVYYVATRQQTTTSRVSTARPVRVVDDFSHGITAARNASA